MKTLNPVPYPKSYENKFERMMEYMTTEMSKQFKNETLNKLNKGTVGKFQDAQVGNYANIFLGLSNTAKRKIKKRFSNKRLDKEVKRLLLALNKNNQNIFYNEYEQVTGIPVKQMIAKEGLVYQNNALILETLEWVKKLRDDNLAYFTNNSLRIMTGGANFSELESGYIEEAGKRKNHAKFIARNQLANFNGISNKLRAQKVGITKAVWVTSKDERVRPSHQQRNGKEFDLKKGLYSSLDGKYLLTGVDYQCRCISRMVLPDEE